MILMKPKQIYDISDPDAETIIKRAVEKAIKLGIQVVVSVWSRQGYLKSQRGMDGAPTRSTDIAAAKAKTAFLFQCQTAELVDKWQPGSKLATIQFSNGGGLLAVPGGYPIDYSGQTIGGLGVSGGTPQQDCQVAEFALGLSSSL